MAETDAEIGLVVVGDEILSGLRRDGHMAAVIERLDARGLELTWAQYAGDDRPRLARLFAHTMASPALVFCCGGIGATPDDVTRAAAADAAGVPLQRHREGTRLLEARFGADIAETRLRMVDFPAGAALIPNPVNRVPGFQLGRHCFLPGFPEMAWPMIEWTLDHRFADWTGEATVSRSVRVQAHESDLVPLLESLGAQHPDARFSSLPEMQADGGFVVELGVRGLGAAVEPALRALEAELSRAGFPQGSR